MDLVTVASIKQLAPINQTTDDGLLGVIVAAVNVWIPNWLNRSLDSTQRSDLLDGNGSRVLMTPEFPITAVASLAVDGTAIPAASSLILPGYRFHNRVLMLNDYRFTRGIGNVEVTYTAGYSTPPADLAFAATELALLAFRDRERVGLTSKSVAGEVIGLFNGEMPARVKSILQPYKNVVPL